MTENYSIAVLLFSLLAMVASLGSLLVCLAIRWRRHRDWSQRSAPGFFPPESVGGRPPGTPRQACPTTWLAIRTSDLAAVQRAFALDDPRPCAWTDGLAAGATRRVYVSPPVAGWILVTGAELPEPSVDIDACYRFLVGLSRRLGQVQYFHRDCGWQHHAWARLAEGRVLRAYAWIGHTAWNEGHVSAAERELRLNLYAYAEPGPRVEAETPPEILNNLERLPQLAARWSIDPSAVEARFWLAHPGISGEISVPRLL